MHIKSAAYFLLSFTEIDQIANGELSAVFRSTMGFLLRCVFD